MIVCGQCGEKGQDARMRCAKCGSRTIQRRTSFNSPLQGDQDRWANRYLLPNPTTSSPHLRRQTIPLPHLERDVPRQHSDPGRPLESFRSPFEVFLDDSTTPTTLHHPHPLPPVGLRAKAHNVLRPTLKHAYTAPLPPPAVSVPLPSQIQCEHDCGCGKDADVPKQSKVDPHARTKTRLFGDLRKVCQRPGHGASVSTLAKGDHLTSHGPAHPLSPFPLDVSSGRGIGSPLAPFITNTARIPSSYPIVNYSSQDRYPSLVDPSQVKRCDPDYLPLTSIPQNITQSPLSYTPITPVAATNPAPRTFPVVRIDIVPEPTPVSVRERKATSLREMSREVGSVTAPSARAAGSRAQTVAEMKSRYELGKMDAKAEGKGEQVMPRRKTVGMTPRIWPPVAMTQYAPTRRSSSGRKSPRAAPKHSGNGVDQRAQHSSADLRLMSMLKPSGPFTIPASGHVRVTTVKSSHQISKPITSREASISSVETVIVRNLSPVLPPAETSDVARIRTMFEAILPPQSPLPRRKFASTPRCPSHTSSISIPKQSSSISTVHLKAVHQQSASNLSKTGASALGGNMAPCPCCGDKIAFFDRDRVVGPYGTVWHQSCLKCGAGEGAGKRNAGKGCGKALDSRAGVDLAGTVWCKRCSLENRPRLAPTVSASPALPPQPSQKRIISLKHPQPMRIHSPCILFRDCTDRWPTPVRLSSGRYGLLRRTSSTYRRRTSGRVREAAAQ